MYLDDRGCCQHAAALPGQLMADLRGWEAQPVCSTLHNLLQWRVQGCIAWEGVRHGVGI